MADKRVLHALRDAGHDLEARDLSVEVAQSTRLSRGSQLPWPTGERVLVRSRATTSGSTDAPAGAASSGGSAPRAVVLELRWTDGGWRVSSVEAPAR